MALILAYFSYAMWAHNWVLVVDHATLALHEAGHPALGLVSERLMVYGGSFFQLLFPALVCRHFIKQGQAIGLAFGLGWLSTAVHSMGVYIADARAQALPLVGNGHRLHDWTEILGRWGLMAWDERLGGLAAAMSWAIMGMALLLLWRLWRSQGESESSR